MRLFPGLMLAAAIGAGMKIASVAEGLMSPSTAYAAASPAPDTAQTEAHKGDAKQSSEQKDGNASAASPQNKASNQEKAHEKPSEAAAPIAQADVSSRGEADVLERLSQRRQELEARERDLALRENMIQAAEKRVAERVEELKTIEGQVKALLAERDKQEQEQLTSLVRMYEAMKPGEAARIFEKLDKTVLVPVAASMKPAKVAGVLAAMEPVKAQELTVLLATRLNSHAGQGAAKADPSPQAPAASAPAPATPPAAPTDLNEALKPALDAPADAPAKAETAVLKPEEPGEPAKAQDPDRAPVPHEAPKPQPTPISHETAPSAH